jgi:1-deoxy-D-xylulose-5-phosphate synthase
VHTITKKGKGYEFAEKNPSAYHGTGAFDISKPLVIAEKKDTFAYSLDKVLCEQAEKNKNIIGICAAMEDAVGMSKFHKKFPERFYDAGICEGHAVTFAAGMAISGKTPVVAIYSTFMQRAYDNVISDVALTNQHVVFCMDRAGISGEDGETHHGLFDVSYMLSIPNMTVLTPRCPEVFEKALETAINEIDGPVSIRYPKSGMYNNGKIPEDIFKAELLREGNSVTVITMSRMTEVVASLDFDGDHINLNCIKPIDKDAIIKSASKTGRVITVEDNIVSGGLGDKVAEILEELKIPVTKLGIDDRFVTHGKVDELLRELKLDKDSILKVIEE